MSGSTSGIHVISRRMVRPLPPAPRHHGESSSESRVIHLTPWDLRLLTVDYSQKGVLLPKHPSQGSEQALADSLATSFASALGRFYPLAGRLAVEEHGGATVTVSLCCNDEGAEFIHAAAPGIAATDVVVAASLSDVPPVAWSLFPLNGMVGADAATGNRPVLAVQVTELADGVFLAASVNHAVCDATTFWHFLNTWSEISRRAHAHAHAHAHAGGELSTPPPILERWFMDASRVPIPLPFPKLAEHVAIRRFGHSSSPARECFFAFSKESVARLKATANAEMAGGAATTTISSLQSLLAHLWRAVCRARRLAPEHKVAYVLVVGCRGRVRAVQPGYMGNAVETGTAVSTAGDVMNKGLGWAAWLLNRAVASIDEASIRGFLAGWVENPRLANPQAAGPAVLVTGNSPRFDVYGNDFGWGRPLAVRSGRGNKMDGSATVHEGAEGVGSMALEVCLEPDALARLVADEEFMAAVTTTP